MWTASEMAFGIRSREDREPRNRTNQTYLRTLVRLTEVTWAARGVEWDGVGGVTVATAVERESEG